jgi:hypothetical protein
MTRRDKTVQHLTDCHLPDELAGNELPYRQLTCLARCREVMARGWFPSHLS